MLRFPLSALLALALISCGDSQEAPSDPALPVAVHTVQEQDIPNIIELPGRVEAVRVAEVRARVTGIVQRRLYEEGSNVRVGQPLFAIDPAESRATVAQVRASLQRARATAANAQAVVNRFEPLVAEQAISQQEYDAAVAASREANASVAQIRAQLDSANLQLGYTTVRAPLSGRVRAAEVTEGALVSAGDATLMTRIEQTDRVYVTFAQSSARVLDIRRGLADGSIVIDQNTPVEVELIFEDGSPYGIPGFIDFLDFSVNESTGTVDRRAEFANPSGLLLPGEFVRARIFLGVKNGGYMVPQRAVQVSETGSSVMVIDSDGKAASRPVELGAMTQSMWIIESGLTAGDRVITSNLQKVRPGSAVTAKPSKASKGSKPSKPKPSPSAPSAEAEAAQ